MDVRTAASHKFNWSTFFAALSLVGACFSCTPHAQTCPHMHTALQTRATKAGKLRVSLSVAGSCYRQLQFTYFVFCFVCFCIFILNLRIVFICCVLLHCTLLFTCLCLCHSWCPIWRSTATTYLKNVNLSLIRVM